nr:retrovirus-related Pol polyprotein from transposon TNT 1-94 [Tanacetum cinerariifolium]
MGQTNQTVYMIMPSKDNLYNGRKGIGFENPSYVEKAKDLRPTPYDEKVIGLGYTLMFLTHSDEDLEIEKFKRSRENKIEFAYDYGNLNASYLNEKINFEDDYFQEIINPDFEKIDSPFQQTSSLKPYVSNVILEKIIIVLEDEVVNLLEKEKANLETIESLKSKGFESSENVIAPGMFKLSVSHCVLPISMSKSSCESNNFEIKLKRKRRKRKSSKQDVKQVNNDVSRTNSDFVHFSDLDTFSSVRRPMNSGVIWKKKGSFNTSNVDLSAVSVSNLNKNVKRYSRKDLLACNNSHLGETSSAYVRNDAMNVSCNPRMCDLLDDNNFFIFDDESVKISPVSKMPFRKKPRDSMNVCYKNNSNKSLPRIVHKELPKLQPLAERIVQICLWIIDLGCSKHMTGNHALLTNFLEKFLGTVFFGNNDFAVIAGYGDVVIGSMTIKKVYYAEGLGHNLFSVGQFCDKGLKVTFRKSTCLVRNEDGVDLLTGDRSSNLYTISLNEVASNSLTCLLAKASSSQSWLWHQRLSHLNFATIINLVKNNLVQGLPKMKFEKDHLCSACEQGKIHRKHHKSKMDFASNKPLYLLHMDLCGSLRVQSINGKRYVLVFVNDYSQYTWVFFLHSKDEASKVIISFIKKTQVNLQLQVQLVRTDNGTEFKNKTLAKSFDEDIRVFVGYSKESASFRIYNKQTRKIHESVNVNFDKISEMASKQFSLESGLSNLNEREKSSNPSVSKVSEASKKNLEDLFQDFYDEYFDSLKIMKSSTTNIETSINEEVFHEVSESFQGESFLSLLNDDVQHSLEEVILPQPNTQSISINMIPNGDEASTSHNVFNERLEDAYFDASTSFHDPSNVQTFYQPYPHEKKWTKDHSLHKIIGDPKLSVRTRGQLANSCLFSCLLSSIEPVNVAEALKDVDWFSAMQEELDQFTRLKTSFLNGILKEEVYVGKPPGFVSKQYPNHVYALDKDPYGLKQAPW